MRLSVLKLLLFCALSACSQTEVRPAMDVPAELFSPVPQPVMHGTTQGDLWRLISRQKQAIATGNSKLAAIECVYRARTAIIRGDRVPVCEAWGVLSRP